MPSYNINIRTDSHIADTTPIEVVDHRELRKEMARFVGELLSENGARIWHDQHWQIDVTDSSGLILYVIHINAAETSATAGSLKRGE